MSASEIGMIFPGSNQCCFPSRRLIQFSAARTKRCRRSGSVMLPAAESTSVGIGVRPSEDETLSGEGLRNRCRIDAEFDKVNDRTVEQLIYAKQKFGAHHL